tara:strand:- start:29025 stop:29483 length:459 start_codon:yes stop_codon:yes gene_type:complete
MKRIKTIKDFFRIEELVDKGVYDKFGESAWRFMDEKLLDCLLAIRNELGVPISVNNWIYGGRFTQRGLRHNRSPLVTSRENIYLSAHMFGKAVDFDVSGMTAVEVREWIVKNPSKIPCKIRLERNLNGKPITWVHLDVMSDEDKPKVYQFDV